MEFKRLAKVFKRDGVIDPFIYDTGFTMVTDHIMAQIVDNRDGSYSEDAPLIPNLLLVEVDDYEPHLGRWDAEEWADRQTAILLPATKTCWRVVHAIARKLQKGMPACLDVAGTLVSFAPGNMIMMEIS
jgi:hypothetical protein